MRRNTFLAFGAAEGDPLPQGVLYKWDASTPPGIETLVSSVVAGGYRVAQLVVGRDDSVNFPLFYLLLRSDKTLWAWSPEGGGVYGYPGTPVQISLATPFVQIAADNQFCAAIDINGRLWAWGDAFSIGTGNTPSVIPMLVSVTGSFRSVNVRNSSALALRHDGKLFGWGDNSSFQLGIPSGSGSTPVQVSGNVSFIKFKVGDASVGAAPSVGLSGDHKVYCWGRNLEAQSGVTSTIASITVPTALNAGATFKDVYSVHSRGLALDFTGNVWTWGAGGTAPVWHTGTQHSPSNRNFTAKFDSFPRSNGEHPYAFKRNQAWGWDGARLGDGSTPTTPARVISAPALFDVIESRPVSTFSNATVYGLA